jgi:Methyltransferase domain
MGDERTLGEGPTAAPVTTENDRPEGAAVKRGRLQRESITKRWRPAAFTASLRALGGRRSGVRPADMPAVDPARDREIDDAIEVLRTVPFEELQRRGWHLQPSHYYWPLNDVAFLREHPEVWTGAALPAGVDWDIDAQLRVLEGIAAYAHELDDVRDGPAATPGEYVWGTPFPKGDAYSYYGLVRQLRPRRVIEVGAGWSSLVLRRALEANRSSCEVTLIDPAPDWPVLGTLPPDWRVAEKPVQLVDLGWFEALEAGDVLFYDGSHCVHTGSDVNWIFFEVLPRLAEGVWIHIHDIAWPWDYHPEWVLDEGLSWNEQYLLQAFLMNNDAYRVRLSVSMVGMLRRREIRAFLPPMVGGSVWIEKLASTGRLRP